MEKSKTSINADKKPEWHVVILSLALFLGSILRIFPGAMAGFPLNDGGMFFVMIRDLRLNHYLLPDFTTYNFFDIPFTYPPLGLYLAAVLRDVFGLPELEALRWLPVIANLISIYAVYLLATKILSDHSRAAIASAFYALTPGSYDWFIMGGGLTRSFGYLFLLFSLYFFIRTLQIGTLKNVLLASLFCALTVLSHPEAALHLAASCLLFWIFLGRTKRGILNATLVGLGTILLTSPWWLTLLAYHGIDPVISALQTGMYHRNPFVALMNNIFARDTYIPILMVLRIIGLGWAIWKRQFLLPAWLALPYFVEPRSAPVVTFFSFCMLIALALADALPAFAGWLKRNEAEGNIAPHFIELRWLNGTIFLLLIYLFVESSLFSFRLINTTLKPREIEAMTWVNENTPEEARFLVITGNPDAMVDPLQEWFPALAGRRSQTTLQGLEWTLADGFFPRFDDLTQLQSCEQVMCIENWSKGTGIEFTHLLVDKKDLSDRRFEALQDNYEILYESGDIFIYKK